MISQTNISAHLTEDELDEALLEPVSGNQRIHLAGCPDCRVRLEQFHGTVALFNQASTAWSEARSNALNRDLNQHRTPLRFTSRTAWTCASALILLTAVSAGIEFRQHSETMMAAQSEQRRIQAETNLTLEADGKNEIASDNAMLLQIDNAINSSDPSPQQMYGIRTSMEASSNQVSDTRARD